MTEQTRALLQRAIDHYSVTAQIYKTMEEMGELIHAIARFEAAPQGAAPEALAAMRDNIAEEIADVEIMLEQLRMIYMIGDEAKAWEYKKLMRLRDRLDGEEAAGL